MEVELGPCREARAVRKPVERENYDKKLAVFVQSVVLREERKATSLQILEKAVIFHGDCPNSRSHYCTLILLWGS